MRPTLASMLICLAACATQPAAEAPAVQSAERQSANIQIVERVAPGVHVMRQFQPTFSGVIGNVTVIEQSDGLVLVDSGSTYGAGMRVVEAVRRISDKPVKAVIITHYHSDHPFGLSAIIAAWPSVDIIATQGTAAAMEHQLAQIPRAPSTEYETTRRGLLQQGVDFMQQNAADASLSERERAEWTIAAREATERMADVPGTYLVPPRTTFAERHVIPDSRTPIEAVFLGRANTDGDAVIWLPRQRILIAGDAVVEPIPYMFNMYPSEQIAVLERIRQYNFRALIPGHGQVLRDRAYLDQLIAFMREAQAQMTPLAQQGLTLEEATARTDFSAQRDRFAGDDPWLRYWFGEYALTPLLDSVYREAKAEPLGPPPP